MDNEAVTHSSLPRLLREITQQRAVIEVRRPLWFDDRDDLRAYTEALVTCIGMKLVEPVWTSWCDGEGWGVFAHITTSCIEGMAYNRRGYGGLTIDIYSCKAYNPKSAAEFTAHWFGIPAGAVYPGEAAPPQDALDSMSHAVLWWDVLLHLAGR